MTALHDLSATAQCEALRRGELSSRELLCHYLDRIDRLAAPLGAFVQVFHDQALAAADAADERLGAWRRQSGQDLTPALPPLPPLLGLPLPLKDLHPSAGLPTSLGSAALAGWCPPRDGAVVARLRQAGVVLLGKTHAPEFGPCCYTESHLAPPALTPYAPQLRLSASGSSGGAAAAVAAGLAPLAHASDGLGSTRTPAANCGLVGIKPSRGQLPAVMPQWYQLGTEGPVARSVADAALFLDAVGAHGPGDLWRQPAWAPDHHRRAARTPPGRPLRVGLLTDPGTQALGMPDGTAAVHADCLAACHRSARALEDLGHQVLPVALPEALRIGALVEPLCDVIGVNLSQTVQLSVPESRRGELMPYTQWYLERAAGITGLRYAQGLSRLAQAASAWLAWMAAGAGEGGEGGAGGVDLLLTPTTTAPALPAGALRLDDGWQSSLAMLRWSAFTPWANFCGAPAISLPVHQTEAGVPVGVQLMAAPGQDALLLGLAGQLEAVFDWPVRHPPGW